MTISNHLKTFAGRSVRDYKPGKKGKKSSGSGVYRVRSDDNEYDDDSSGLNFAAVLDQFLEEHSGKKLTALVVGRWNSDDMVSGEGSGEVVEALAAGRDRMPNLKHLFLGDIVGEECEISWITHGDISPLLPAFPKLEEFRIRGASNVTFGKIKHDKLKSFAIESGGLPDALLKEVWKAKLPKLEHLELWLGTESYEGITEVEPLEPLLTGKLFPKLRYLGLRNSEIADKVAEAVAESPLLERLQTLDLSLGNLGDRGAEALLKSAGIRKLKKLDLHHHYISPPFVNALKELEIEIDLSEQLKPEFYSYGDSTEVWRYITVSE